MKDKREHIPEKIFRRWEAHFPGGIKHAKVKNKQFSFSFYFCLSDEQT